ncbi:hypothetical protein [Marilutibacter alkalisoli]|uniref:Uncharacterized protein n=1 Tax=Marilutibacter alkalisoli TaxID=2591633 RepID=A0A514BTX3_9GAMM|nr:hypothetical protein [Lysobacter alkalisoli]QDH70822.1 hypothetical protein FKV23_12580 [Lysobacter alkalisoli]
MIRRTVICWFAAALSLSCALIAQAQPVSVPAPLEPWREWVLQDEPGRDCPLLAGAGQKGAQRICVWPGVLHVQADAGGVAFALRYTLQKRGRVVLPGDVQYWPQQVTANGNAVPVVRHAGRPGVWLDPGHYELRGRIPWAQRPQALALPAGVSLVELQVDGQSIRPLQRDGDNLVLGRGESAAPEADALDIRVYRKLGDGLPAELETRILLTGAGQAREELIGPVLPAGFAPLTLDGDWPARLESDGRLRVQVQPEQAELVLRARMLEPLQQVQLAAQTEAGKPWPAQEIWSYEAAPALRSTSAGGPVQVDPDNAGVPEDWHALPAFALEPSQTITIEERARGVAADEGNRLSLQREAWLDFAGGGWTLRDRMEGEMRRDWRLEAAAPYILERAQSLVENAPLLVTRLDEEGAAGVEWRTPRVGLDAGLRLQSGGGKWPIAGWRQSFDTVTTTVHLPYGYRLFAAPGADRADGSWMSRWTLLDVFIAAVIALLSWRLFGWTGAGLAAVYLLLAYHERGAPILSLGVVLALALIVQALPAGRLRRIGEWARRAALVLLVLIALPFVATQLRMALHPQLEGAALMPALHVGMSKKMAMEAADAAATAAEEAYAYRELAPPPEVPAVVFDDPSPVDMPALPPPPPTPVSVGQGVELDSIMVTGSRIKRADVLDRYTQGTVVQTGRGLPSWQGGHSYRLRWSGPITQDQSVRLLISPPWLTRLLRVLAVALLALLALRVLGVRLRWPPLRPVAAALAAFALAGPMMVSPAHAQASMPSPELLEELKNRLTRLPDCAPDCATIAAAQVRADGDDVRIALDVHAAARVFVPLPVDDVDLSPLRLRVDGADAGGVLQAQGRRWIVLDRGVHRVEIETRAMADKAVLAFPLPPARIAFDGAGWQASGITDNRLPAGSLTLARSRETGSAPDGAATRLGAQEFPPYVRLTRHLDLGLDWHLRSVAERLAPEEGGFTVKLPLVAGEKVGTAGLEVRAGHVELPIPDGDDTAEWRGSLDKTDTLTLTAPALNDHAEVWEISASPLWHLGFEGVPESAPLPEDDANDWHVFRFYPLPGETLKITVSRPAAASGATRAIDAVRLQSQIGQRAGEHTLGLTVRASQGGDHTLVLPAGAEVLSVRRGSEVLNLRPQDGRLSLPLLPGVQRFEIRFRDSEGVAMRNTTPSIDLGLPAANIDLRLDLPRDRWVLLTRGPRLGPAVLYWGELLVLVLVAFALSRLRWAPLKLHEWLLLGIGFSTFSWLALFVVVAWLFAVAWRDRNAVPPVDTDAGNIGSNGMRFNRLGFNLAQIGLVVLTLAAAFALVAAIPYGLLGSPDMHIRGNGSTAHALSWFADQSTDILPRGSAITMPMWLYRTAMLAWALWLAVAVLRWAGWGFRAWVKGGYWRSRPKSISTPPPLPDEKN